MARIGWLTGITLIASVWIGFPGDQVAAAATAGDTAQASAQKDSFALTGLSGDTKTYRLADLQALPATTITVYFGSSHGPMHAVFQGVELWALLQQTRLTSENGPRNEILKRTITITGADGYEVVLSGGELSPSFGAEPAIIAYAQDSKPLRTQDGGFARLIVPGDKLGGRNVTEVVRIQVR